MSLDKPALKVVPFQHSPTDIAAQRRRTAERLLELYGGNCANAFDLLAALWKQRRSRSA
jgi:hypothetical protein